MVIDHHQFNVFGLILYTVWRTWSLRRKNTVCDRQSDTFFQLSLNLKLFNIKDNFRKAHTANTKINSCLMRHWEKKRRQINKGELCKARPGLSVFQIKMRAALRAEGPTAADIWLCLRKDENAASTHKVNISWKRIRRGERGVESCCVGGEWGNSVFSLALWIYIKHTSGETP